MRSRFEHGLTLVAALMGALVLFAPQVQAQADLGEQVQLELRQLRAEVDFLRDQLETGGGVADVRFEDLQRRLDTVLEDAAALASEAGLAQRRAEAAGAKVDRLERRIGELEDNIDTLATRLARLEADSRTAAEPAAASAASEAGGAAQADSFLAEDGVRVPLPKDRSATQPPTREVTSDVALGDEAATILPLTEIEAADPAATAASSSASADAVPATAPDTDGADAGLTEGTATAEAALVVPVLPSARPTAPGRASPTVYTAPAATPAPAQVTDFAGAKALFARGDYRQAAASLQTLIDTGQLSDNAPEGHYLLGTAYLSQGQYTAAIQALAQGLRQYPASDYGAPSIINLADALRANGQRDESCRLLRFVEVEYPLAQRSIDDASQRIAQFGC